MNRLTLLWFVCLSMIVRAEDYETILKRDRLVIEEQLNRINTTATRSLEKWPVQYRESLKGLEAKLKKAGNLEGVLAIRKESERFAQQKQIPQESVVETPEELRELQLQAMKEPGEIELRRNAQFVQVTDEYVAILDELKKKLTKKGSLEQALSVNKEVERARTTSEYAAAKTALDAGGVGANVPRTANVTKPESSMGNGMRGLASLRKDLILYYSFDRKETANGETTDDSGKGHNAKVHGAKWAPNGKFGSAYSFDGSGSTFLDAGNPGNIGERFTIALWANPTVWDSYRSLLSKDNADNGFSLEKAADSEQLKFWYFDTAFKNVTFGDAPPLNTWSFLAVTHDGSTVRAFFNGRQVAAGDVGHVLQEKSNLYIGRHALAEGARNWNGLLDEVMVFGRALSGDEIKALYTAK